MSGFYLDVNNKESVDEIFSSLEQELISMPSNLKNLYKSVLDLRANNWGHSVSQPSSTNGYNISIVYYKNIS